MPTAPPTRAIAPVGKGPAAAKPELGAGAAEPETDAAPEAAERDADAPDAAVTTADPELLDSVGEAEAEVEPDEVITTNATNAPKEASSPLS
jgi:hypothetical protein